MNPMHHCQQHLKGLLNSWATAFYKLAQQSVTGNLKDLGGVQHWNTWFCQMATIWRLKAC